MKRIENLMVFKQAGLNTGLIIKPFLAGITNKDIKNFIKVINEYNLKWCVLGIFYANNNILDRFEKKQLITKEMDVRSIGKHHFPRDEKKVTFELGNGDSLDNFSMHLKKATGILVFKTSMCAVANRLNIPDPMRTWRRYPDLCIKCQDCEKLVSKLETHIQRRFDVHPDDPQIIM
ncbi:MAG: hypothetical protein ACYS5F_15565, partial [Planctomycetota bacterium]